MYNNNDNWYTESNKESANEKLSAKRFRPPHLGLIIALGILVLLVVVLGSTTLYLLLSQQNKTQLSAVTPVVQTSNPAAPISPTSASSGATTTAQSTATPALTDTPTTSATQKTITENKQFTCADCQGQIFYIKVILEKIILDSSTQTMTFQFHFTNTSTTDSFNTYFDQLYLQDNINGSRYDGQGDDAHRPFELAPGNDVIALPSFPLAPTQGRGYTLHLSVSSAATMKNEVFTF